MKFIFALIFALGFSTANADYNPFDVHNSKIVCTAKYSTLVLYKTGKHYEFNDENGEYVGVKAPFYLEVFRKGEYYPARVSAKGTVLTEDVYFEFTSEDKSVFFSIYLDEMETGKLVVKKGESTKKTDYVCY